MSEVREQRENSLALGLAYREVTGLKQRFQCWQLSRAALLSPHYGLTATRILPTEYRRLISHKYLQVLKGAEPIGVRAVDWRA